MSSTPSPAGVVVCPDPVFIIGSPRSGTTALAFALGWHSRFWTGGEMHLLWNLLGDTKIDDALHHEDALGGFVRAETVERPEFLRYLGLGINALITSRSGGRRWVDQTPVNTLMVDTIAEMFPGAKFVHLLRDGREVVDSMIRYASTTDAPGEEDLPEWAVDFDAACRMWAESVDAALAFEVRHPDRCITVPHRLLLTDPTAFFTHVFEFLDAKFEPGPRWYVNGFRPNSSFEPDRAFAERPPAGSDWTNDRQIRFEEIAGRAMQAAGLNGSDGDVRCERIRVAAERVRDHETERKRTRAARVIALYLPQFYPTPQNDKWWGKGFTEWTNVVQARPLFAGHQQPRLPANTGFYDLRVPDVRRQQAALAAEHGIEGFCYWHYWFHGRRVLERPFDEVLASGEPDLPFCLAWANETWSRRWHGRGPGHEVLEEQTYSDTDDVEHARWLVRAFADDRYIRVGGRPLFLVYRPFDLPDSERTTDTLRKECVRAGLAEPYLVGINAHNPTKDTRPLGFDTTLNFEPQLSAVPGPTEPGLKIYDYVVARRRMLAQTREYPTIPCVMVSWDNTPRQGENGIVFINATPENFEAGLVDAIRSVGDRDADERIVFVNAWNEWAEGNYLEPDLADGLARLEAVERAVFGR